MYTETLTFSLGHYCFNSLEEHQHVAPLSSKWGQTRPADDDPRCQRHPSFKPWRSWPMCAWTILCFPIYFQFLLSGWHWCALHLWLCHHKHLGDDLEMGVLADSLRPFSPIQPPTALTPFIYFVPTLKMGIFLAYIGHILALYIGPIWTLSTHSHN